MQIPLEVRYGDDVERTSRIESVISERAQKLDHFCDHIISCRVAVERPHHAASSGNPYRVRIDVTVPPGHELVVDKGPPNVPFEESLETNIIESFKAMERQLKELTDRQQGEVKSHRGIERMAEMNWDQIEGKWKQYKGQAREKWGSLTDDDIEWISGKRDRLVGKIQERYGRGKEAVEKQVDEWRQKLSAK